MFVCFVFEPFLVNILSVMRIWVNDDVEDCFGYDYGFLLNVCSFSTLIKVARAGVGSEV